MTLYIGPSNKGSFSDKHVEESLSRWLSEIEFSHRIEINFQRVHWFDLWALIQLLFLIEHAPKNIEKRLILLDPADIEADIPSNTDALRFANARLRFLFEMEFLHAAEKLGVKIFFAGKDRGLMPTVARDVQNHILTGEGEDVSGTKRTIIPITRVSDIDLDKIRDLLHTNPELFDVFFSESIVQQAGLGDCLLSELVSNVIEHGDENGYVALRAVGGVPHTMPDRLKARQNHPLGDWKRFYQIFSADPYFELIVSDQGPGISSTIIKDANLPEQISKMPDSIEKEHQLISYSLQPTSSRLTIEERREKELTDFTGLGAINHTLMAHDGSIFVREKSGRHFFGSSSPSGLFITKLGRNSSLNFIKGTTVTVVIPILSRKTKLSGYPILVQDSFDANLVSTSKVIRIIKNTGQRPKTILDKEYGSSWRDAEKILSECQSKIVVVDLEFSPVEKNELWRGLQKVIRLCWKKGITLFLGGIDARIATRIYELAFGDDCKIADGRSWILIGFGNKNELYVFGLISKNKPDEEIKKTVALSINKTLNVISEEVENLLVRSNYFKRDDSNGTIHLHIGISDVTWILHYQYAATIESHIKNTDAWITNTAVKLTGGDIVGEYLCIHSITQMQDIFPDISRLIISMVTTFDFDVVLSVGVASHPVAKKISEYYSITEQTSLSMPKLIPYYIFHDYFGFDHGETTSSMIKPDTKVLLIVDGLRKGEHCQEAISHVQDCGANVVAIIALVDLREDSNTSLIEKLPFRSALKLPVTVSKSSPSKLEIPYSFTLHDVSEAVQQTWRCTLSRRLTYQRLQSYRLIYDGHSIFLQQHFARSIALPLLFSSSTSLKAEIITSVRDIISRHSIDTIIYPEHSSIPKLVSDIIFDSNFDNEIHTVVCRRAVWPNRSSSYSADVISEGILQNAKNILIIDDQAFTGGSIKDVAAICEVYGVNINKIVVYVVIDSMMEKERIALTQYVGGIGLSKQKKVEVEYGSFMRIILNWPWTAQSCPLCKKQSHYENQLTPTDDYFDDNYANQRLRQLKPIYVDHNYKTRKKNQLRQKFETGINEQGSNKISVFTEEGLKLLCEEMYATGEIKWLIDRLSQGHNEPLPLSVLPMVIELLSTDMSLLLRVRQQRQFLDHLDRILRQQRIQGYNLARVLEIMSEWPLYCLNRLWQTAWKTAISQNTTDLSLTYPGLKILYRTCLQLKR